MHNISNLNQEDRINFWTDHNWQWFLEIQDEDQQLREQIADQEVKKEEEPVEGGKQDNEEVVGEGQQNETVEKVPEAKDPVDQVEERKEPVNEIAAEVT